MKNQTLKFSVLVVSIFVILFSISYAFLNMGLQGEKRQVVSAGNLQLEFQEGKAITLGNAMPVYDEVGMIQDPFTFKLVNNGSIPINYIVKLVDVTSEDVEKLDTDIVKYGLTRDGFNIIAFLSNLENGQLDRGMILANQTIEYDLRLWIDFDVEDEGLINEKSLSYRIEVEAGQVDGTERKIQFDLDGGQATEITKTVVVGEKYGALPSPTKTGYNFLGWFNEKDEYVDENTILDAFTQKLTAKWGVNQYTVAFNSNGGSVSPNNKQVTFDELYGEMPIPTKGDSIFLGWFTELSNGEKVESTSVMNVASNQTLYAHWKDPYQDKSGASRPVLSNELIPIKIANNGEVRKASIYEEWYDYDKKTWANAVILSNKSITYSDNQIIPESNIESYFVWIPRYRYKIFNMGNYSSLTSLNVDAPQPIEIEFESKETALSNGTAKDEWLSHPAFQTFDTNGLWIGKFESGYRGANTTAEAQVSTADSTKLVIKPNIYSWRDMNIGNMFKTSYEYLRDNESHMMKNTEWGAVAYLSHSKYGINREVYINNNSSCLTGCGGATADASENSSCLNAYGSKLDGIYNQSTTGNISGIFDMSGGAIEYVMGNAGRTGGSGGITNLYSDFFANNEWDKYYDKYTSNSHLAYNNRILGDATGEMGPFADGDVYHSSWYSDRSYFVNASYPWFSRGGGYSHNSRAGIFFFSYGHGAAASNILSFRVTLSLN